MRGFRTGLMTGLLLAVFGHAAPLAQAANPFRGSGFQLGEGDAALLEAAAQSLYLTEIATVGTIVHWDNPETGNRGTVTLIAIHEQQGLPCRRLQHDIELRRVRDPYRFIVDRCRSGDGEWIIFTP